MDWVSSSQKTMEIFRKYRYFILALLLGSAMLLLPGKNQADPAPATEAHDPQTQDLQKDLEELLSHMEGAGKVKVLLTQAVGEKKIYQTNDDVDSTQGLERIRRETVVLTDSQRMENGLIQQMIPPVYLGAVVLCQGADSASVRLAVVEAVSNVTGLATHNISVLKMK